MPPGAGVPPSGSGTGGESVRHKITSWMEAHLGRAAMPAAAVAGGLVGGGAGMLLLGVPGAVVGGLGGAFMGAVLFMAG